MVAHFMNDYKNKYIKYDQQQQPSREEDVANYYIYDDIKPFLGNCHKKE